MVLSQCCGLSVQDSGSTPASRAPMHFCIPGPHTCLEVFHWCVCRELLIREEGGNLKALYVSGLFDSQSFSLPLLPGSCGQYNGSSFLFMDPTAERQFPRSALMYLAHICAEKSNITAANIFCCLASCLYYCNKQLKA